MAPIIFDSNAYEHFWQQLAIAEQSILMLDFDGTLAPFQADRESVRFYPGVQEPLEQLIENPKVILMLISGRSIASLRQLLSLKKLPVLWGSHGHEHFDNASGTYTTRPLGPAAENCLELIKKNIIDKVPNEAFEDKPFGLALHNRACPQLTISYMHSLLTTELEQAGGLHLMHLKVFDGGVELVPKGQSKKNVVHEVLSTYSKETPIAYLGDDLTDEEAFAELAERGLKCLVRNEFRKTLADIQLHPPEDLIAFFERWILQLTKRKA